MKFLTTIEGVIQSKKIIYAAVVLSEDSRQLLLEWSNHILGEPEINIVAHHMTIAFKPSCEECCSLPLGKKVKLQVIGVASDDHCQAVAINPINIKCSNKIPHITISHSNNVKPIYSNDLLSLGINNCNGPILYGIVGVYGR